MDFFAAEFKKNAKDPNDPQDFGDWLNYSFPNTDLNEAVQAHNLTSSDAVKVATGAAAVAEPAAILAARKKFHNSTMIIPKEKRGNVTLAIAKAEFML